MSNANFTVSTRRQTRVIDPSNIERALNWRQTLKFVRETDAWKKIEQIRKKRIVE